jgi:hypothetical protein
MKISTYPIRIFLHSFFFISIIFLVSFRSGDIFFDVDNYISMFEDSTRGFSVNAELTYFYISRFVGWIGLTHIGVFFIYASISITSKYYFLKKTAYAPFKMAILYLVSYFILYEFVQMRVGSAFGLLLVSLVFYIKDKLFLSFLFASLSIFFHFSILPIIVLILLSSFLFSHRSHNKIDFSLLGVFFLLISFFCLFYAFLIFFMPFLDVRGIMVSNLDGFFSIVLPQRLYNGYVGVGFSSEYYFSMKQLLSIFLSCLVIFVFAVKKVENDWVYFLSGVLVILSFWVYFIFGHFGVLAERFAELLILFFIVFVDGVMKKSKNLGNFIYYLSLCLFVYNLIYRASYFELGLL